MIKPLLRPAKWEISTTISILCLTLLARVAHAVPLESPQHHDLERTNWQFLLGESIIGGGAYVSAWLFIGGTRDHCRWCSVNSFDNSIRHALRADNPRPPAYVSHALSLGAIPALGLYGLMAPAGLDRQWHRGLEDTWIVTNTFFVTSAVGEAVKHFVARERPAFHYGVQAATEFSDLPSQRNKSFFSLDTAWAFSIASSSATLSFLRGYSSAPYIAVGGGLLAAGVGTLRIVGDAHWATDVLTGAAVGAGIGMAMPLLLHSRRSGETTGIPTMISVTPLIGGSKVSVAFVL
jgi:membrane-associated phospholipid phosphatase